MEKTSLQKLQDWYASRCNGEWELTYGMTIETINIPGWRIMIDLEETGLSGSDFEEITRHKEGEVQYIHCSIINNQFIGICAPQKLDETVQIFLDGADENRPEKE